MFGPPLPFPAFDVAPKVSMLARAVLMSQALAFFCGSVGFSAVRGTLHSTGALLPLNVGFERM